MFSVYHRNVDGAGFIESFSTLEAAILDAAGRQQRSDSSTVELPNGSVVFNPWCYTYTVFDRAGRVVYRTESVAPRGEFVRLGEVA